MLIIGLTGQTGAGKSTVAGLLQKKHGFQVIDADKIARSVTEKGSPVLATLAREFSQEILNSDGSLNRRRLGETAFSSKENTQKLNSITHPAITRVVVSELKRFEAEGCSACIVDAALLFGSGIEELCDFTAAVVAPEDVREERIVARDSITPQAAKKRMAAQPAQEEYTRNADITVRNYSPFSVEAETEKIIDKYKEMRI